MKILGIYDKATIKAFENEIHQTLDQVDSTYNSWQEILSDISALREEIKVNEEKYKGVNISSQEAISFLTWLKDANFTFLGCLEFNLESTEITSEKGATSIWQNNRNEIKDIINFSSIASHKDKLIFLGKINRLSPVHRSNLVDYVLIKRMDKDGQYKSGTIILGLYGSAIYYQSIKNIPILREKLQYVLKKAGFPSNGYNSKKLKIILESLPQEAIVQIKEADLYCMCLHMLSSMMSKKLKLFIQRDWSESFINVLIFLPRARLTPEVHNSISKYLSQKFSGKVLSDYITEVAQDFSHLFVILEIKEKAYYVPEEIEDDLDKLSTPWIESFYQQYTPCKPIE